MREQDAATIQDAAAPQPGVDARHQDETVPDAGRATQQTAPARAADASREADRSAGDHASRGTPANVSETQETHHATEDPADQPETTEPG